MKFTNPAILEQVVWTMKLADHPRALNRARINSLFNGEPPYSDQEAAENHIAINVNSLEGCKLAHDARSQMANAFLKPGQYFTIRTDMGPVHKRQKYGAIVSKEVNKIMKRCPRYFENLRAKFAQLILHGIGPSAWETRQHWCPDPIGIEDVMIPTNTLITMKNLPFFAIFRSYTAEELYRLTHGPKRDKAWQMDNVNAVLKWADEEAARLSGTTWPQVWSPEKLSERMKEDSGLYASDAVPTIDTWDCYYWSDSQKVSGWNRRIILDGYGQPGVGGVIPTKAPDKNLIGGQGQFLYDPGDRKYGSKISEIISFQFADLSAVAPFRYHSVRSLGFLLYAVGHLQNRLRCRFSEAVFENLLMYMRVKSMDDAERALKINLISRGIIDETVQFLPQAERWQVNAQLAELGLNENQKIINQNSSSYVQSQGKTNPDVEKTAFQVRAELNATTALISSALLQAYQYQSFEYEEIFRRFCIPNSRDPDVRQFRLNCLKQGVPEKMLVPEAWELEPERVMGSGNKTLEMAISQQLMEWRPLYDPASQREILRLVTLSTTDDPGLTQILVPEEPDKLTNSKQKAMVAMGTLMLGLPVKFGATDNRIEVTETLLGEMAALVSRIQKTGGMAKPEQLLGLQTVGQTIAEQLQILSQDKTLAGRVRKYGDDLGKVMNLVKAFEQRLQQAMKAAQANGAGNGGPDPKDVAKAKAIETQAAIKAKNASESHAQRTAQRQVQWEAEEKRKQEEHDLNIRKGIQQHKADLVATDVETAAQIRRERLKADHERKLAAAAAEAEPAANSE
jgi:hypothetical protein